MQHDRTPFHIDTPFGPLAKLIRPRRAFRRTHSLAALSGDLARLGDLDEPKVLQKYMGREQAAAFIQYAREQQRTLADTHAVS